MATTAHDVAVAVLAQVGPMETMRLQKLVYYSQAWHLALLDKPLFSDTIHAWRDGPVTGTLWDVHSGQKRVRVWPVGSAEKLPERSAKVVALVCQVYGGLSGDDLSELTHSEAPWRDARNGLSDDQHSKAVIPHDAMRSFYRTRSLAGQSVADLVSGGVSGLAVPDLDATERSRLLAAVREEFRRAPAPEDGPGPPEPFESAFDARCDHDAPPLVNVRFNRERPQRGRTTSA